MGDHRSGPALKPVLGLGAVTFIAVGMTIGGGVFIFTGITLKITGKALPLAYMLAVVPVFVAMMPLAMLGATIPTTGGNYRYPSRMVSPGLAFVGIWTYALASFFGQIPLYALGCARYVQAVVPGVHENLFAVGLVTFFLVVNYFGVQLAARVQGVLVVILCSALLCYAATGTANFHPEHFNGFFERGEGNLLLATALLTFTYLGANGVIELGGEIRNPEKTIPRAFFISIPLVAVIYAGVAVATVGVLPLDRLTAADEPLLLVSQAIFSRTGALLFILCGAVLALTSTLNALFIFGTKSLLMMVADGLLPGVFGRIHPRYKTPHILLAVLWGLSVLGIFSGFSLETLASYAALGGLMVFLPTLLAALRLKACYPEAYERSTFRFRGAGLWICCLTGMGLITFFMVVLVVDLKSVWRIGCFFLFVASGIVFYRLRKKTLIARGEDPERYIKHPRP
ncbi:MAG: amino acid permease [Desulfobacterales bacterium]|nr:amino acid permease [Desulfobacterales bacterium]